MARKLKRYFDRMIRHRGLEPREVPLERVKRTENEEARRRNLDWLRDRDDETAIDFDPEEQYS